MNEIWYHHIVPNVILSSYCKNPYINHNVLIQSKWLGRHSSYFSKCFTSKSRMCIYFDYCHMIDDYHRWSCASDFFIFTEQTSPAVNNTYISADWRYAVVCNIFGVYHLWPVLNYASVQTNESNRVFFFSCDRTKSLHTICIWGKNHHPLVSLSCSVNISVTCRLSLCSTLHNCHYLLPPEPAHLLTSPNLHLHIDAVI